jgi:hypothetical protein
LVTESSPAADAKRRLDDGWIVLDDSLRVGLQRTLRVPTRGGPYPLPPALGRLDVWPATALKEAEPAQADFVVPLHVHEALWLQFRGRGQEQHAVRVAAGRVDAVTGEPWDLALQAAPQNYIVCPYQPWLDGFKTGGGLVRQFVAVRRGRGESVEHQLTAVDTGGITVACYRPAAALPPLPAARPSRGRDLALGAGGPIQQRLYPDPYGADVWQPDPMTVATIRLIDAVEFAARFGIVVPPSPIDAATYTRFGLPWFELDDASRGDIAATPAMASLESTPRGGSGTNADDSNAPIEPDVVKRIPPR